MADSSRCPSCGGDLVEGTLLDRGHNNIVRHANWVDGRPKVGWFGMLKVGDMKLREVQGSRCTNCGLILMRAK